MRLCPKHNREHCEQCQPAQISIEGFRRNPDAIIRAADDGPIQIVDEQGKVRMTLCSPVVEPTPISLRNPATGEARTCQMCIGYVKPRWDCECGGTGVAADSNDQTKHIEPELAACGKCGGPVYHNHPEQCPRCAINNIAKPPTVSVELTEHELLVLRVAGQTPAALSVLEKLKAALAKLRGE